MGRKFKFGYNAAGVYVGPLKRVHRDKKKPSLAARLFSSGRLDVCLDCGAVTTPRGKRKLQKNHKGYFWLDLYDGYTRRGRRRRMSAWVHRLVYMKKLATDAAGEDWREVIQDIDPEIDIDHFDRDRGNNSAGNLRLASHDLHGKRSSANWTAEDEASIEEFNRSA